MTGPKRQADPFLCSTDGVSYAGRFQSAAVFGWKDKLTVVADIRQCFVDCRQRQITQWDSMRMGVLNSCTRQRPKLASKVDFRSCHAADFAKPLAGDQAQLDDVLTGF
jgi:hypothetical protein